MKFILRSLAVFALAISALHATDLSITAASVVPGARAKYIGGNTLAGATITAGQLLYLDSTAQSFKLADADASATTANVVGYAANSASAGQYVGVVTEDDDVTIGATMSTAAGIYVLSATAGGYSPSASLAANMYPVVVLIAKSTTKGIFKITRGTVPATSFVMPYDDVPRFASITRSSRHFISPRRDEIAVALAA